MKVDPLTTPYLWPLPFDRLARGLQCFFLVTLLVAVSGVRATELRLGEIYSLTFTDVDQRQLSTADGHVSVITVVTRKDEEKAQMVGDRFPHSYLADPKYRLINLVNFQQKIPSPFRGLTVAIIRHRLDTEAKELQKVYGSKGLSRNAREDLLVVADFDGKTLTQLGFAPTSGEFAVLMFDGRGRLMKRWNEVPSGEALIAALEEAR